MTNFDTKIATWDICKYVKIKTAQTNGNVTLIFEKKNKFNTASLKRNTNV